MSYGGFSWLYQVSNGACPTDWRGELCAANYPFPTPSESSCVPKCKREREAISAQQIGIYVNYVFLCSLIKIFTCGGFILSLVSRCSNPPTKTSIIKNGLRAAFERNGRFWSPLSMTISVWKYLPVYGTISFYTLRKQDWQVWTA